MVIGLKTKKKGPITIKLENPVKNHGKRDETRLIRSLYGMKKKTKKKFKNEEENQKKFYEPVD